MTKTQKHLIAALNETRLAMAHHPGSLDVDEPTRMVLEGHALIAQALRALGIETALEPPRRVQPCTYCGKPTLSMGRRGRQKSVHEECRRLAQKVKEAAS